MGEIAIGGGVTIPALLAWAGLALVFTMLLRRALAAAGLYRFVWHRPLFDAALGLIVLGAIVAGATTLFGPNVR